MVRAVRFDREKIHVIYNGVDHFNSIDADYTVVEKNGLKGCPFYLTVASSNPNKNIRLLVEAANHSEGDFRFVFAGGQNRHVFASDDPDTSDMSGKILLLGRVSDGRVKGSI